MGRQSSRLYFQGKDHKDIYFQGHYHDAMYVGNQLVWEKIGEKMSPLLANELSSEYVIGDDIVDDVTMYEDGSLSFENMYAPFQFVVFRGENINKTLYSDDDYANLRRIDGWNYGFWDRSNFTILAPGENIFQDNTGNKPSTPAFAYCGYINGMFFLSPVGQYGGGVGGGAAIADSKGNLLKVDVYVDGERVDSHDYTFNRTTYTMHALESNNFQWFAGKLYAELQWGTFEDDKGYKRYGTCYTEDMLHWYTGIPFSGGGTVINGILFLDDGTAYNESIQRVEFTKKPAFYCNDYYYAEELDGRYILRSKDLVNWARYKEIKWDLDLNYTLKAYWRQKSLLLLKGKDRQHMHPSPDGIYKYRIHL